MRSRPGAARTILLFHIIGARPPKQLFFFSRGLGWRMHLGVEVTELITNKQHHLSREVSLISVKRDLISVKRDLISVKETYLV